MVSNLIAVVVPVGVSLLYPIEGTEFDTSSEWRFFGRVDLMLIKVKVFPNSKKEGILKKSEDSYEIKVKQRPVNGKANKAVFEILSAYFKIPKVKIKLMKGFKIRNKVFKIG